MNNKVSSVQTANLLPLIPKFVEDWKHAFKSEQFMDSFSNSLFDKLNELNKKELTKGEINTVIDALLERHKSFFKKNLLQFINFGQLIERKFNL